MQKVQLHIATCDFQQKFAFLNGRGGTVARVEGQLKYVVTLDEAMDNGERDVRVPESKLEAEPP